MLLSERSQFEKATHCTSPSIKHSRKGKTVKTVKSSVVARGGSDVGGMNRWSTEDF